jgi:hypothetical protein
MENFERKSGKLGKNEDGQIGRELISRTLQPHELRSKIDKISNL